MCKIKEGDKVRAKPGVGIDPNKVWYATEIFKSDITGRLHLTAEFELGGDTFRHCCGPVSAFRLAD